MKEIELIEKDEQGEQKFRIGIASGIDEDLDALSIKN